MGKTSEYPTEALVINDADWFDISVGGESQKISGASIKALIGGQSGVWQPKLTFDHADAEFTTGGAGILIQAIAIQPGTIITHVKIKHSESWLGGGLTGVTVKVGYGGGYSTNYDILQSVSATKGQSQAPFFSTRVGNQITTDTVDVFFSFSGGLDTDLTQGTVEIWVQLVELPS